MKNLAIRLLFILSVLVIPAAAGSLPGPVSSEDLLAEAIVDACRLALLRLDPAAEFNPAQVIVHPGSDAVGSLDGFLAGSTALDIFGRGRALGVSTNWFEFVDAAHARRVLVAHYGM